MAAVLDRHDVPPERIDLFPDDIDLSLILASHPVKVMRLDAAVIRDLSASALAVGDLLDACAAVGLDPEQLGPVLSAGGLRGGQVGLAVAWAIARRAYPALTWDEVRRDYRLEIVDTDPPDPTPAGPPVSEPGT